MGSLVVAVKGWVSQKLFVGREISGTKDKRTKNQLPSPFLMSQARFWVGLLFSLGSSSGHREVRCSRATLMPVSINLRPGCCPSPASLVGWGVAAGTLLPSWCYLPKEYRPFCWPVVLLFLLILYLRVSVQTAFMPTLVFLSRFSRWNFKTHLLFSKLFLCWS